MPEAADNDHHFYEPGEGHGLAHDPFRSIVAPRPIGWISTVDLQGRINLAPYSYFNAFSSKPPIVGFACQQLNPMAVKDTLRNARETGEFVFNLVTAALAQAMNLTSACLPHGVDEMAFAGLRPAPSRLVKPPRVSESPAAFECRLLQIVPLLDLNGEATGTQLILGQVVGVHIDRRFTKDGVFDTARARPVARCGSAGDYTVVQDLFEIPRPRFSPSPP
jgi:flavin reductase (DIM6/NTAB) family NADH-FMN oxidoreductase RutF